MLAKQQSLCTSNTVYGVLDFISQLSMVGADKAGAVPETVEFVASKSAKKAKREWKAEQESRGALPNKPKRSSLFLSAIIVLCSTLSAVLFGYRMYIKHYGPIKKQYVRLYLFCIVSSAGV